MLSPSADIPQLAGLPDGIYYAMIVFGSFVFMVAFLGIAGTCLHSKILMSLFIIFDLLLALGLLVSAIIILIYANGITTVKEVDDNAKTFQGMVEKTLYEQATVEKEVWAATQSSIGCCGINLKSTYADYSEFNITSLNEFLNVLQPGAKCADGRTAVLSIHASYSNYTAEAETAADANAALQKYFCQDIISTFIRSNTIIVGAVAAVLVIIQIITAAAAIILLTKVTTTNGGFVPPPEETGNSLAYGAPSNKGGPNMHSTAMTNTLA